MKATPRPTKSYFYSWTDSPIGRLRLVASDAGLAAILWESTDPESLSLTLGDESPTHPVLAETTRQLAEYFAGTRRAFDLPLDFAGTDFQQKVWRALLTIPFGETRSYAQIAKQIGHPTAVRAVGAANGRNPIPIIAPCHRVIGSNGDLTGFGGGLPTKEHLLTHEGARTASIGI
jgi:methylated-DNA-[protein]-cysteine S-methyltransferase